MSYVEKHLLNGDEKIVYQSTLHWITFSKPILFSLFGLLPVMLILLSADLKVLALLPAGLATTVIFNSYLIRKSSEFTVTNKRLIIKVGLIRTKTVQFFYIEGVIIEQNTFGRLLNYGDLIIIGMDGTKELIKNIDAPLEFSRMIQGLSDGRS